MTHYLIKYTGNLWSIEKVFTHLYAAEEYKQILDIRNTSTCKYMIVVCPHIEGIKHLPALVEAKLSKLNSNPIKLDTGLVA